MYRKELKVIEEAEIVSLFKEGFDSCSIVSKVGRSRSTVNRVIRRYKDSNTSQHVINQIKVRTEEDYNFEEVIDPRIISEFTEWDI